MTATTAWPTSAPVRLSWVMSGWQAAEEVHDVAAEAPALTAAVTATMHSSSHPVPGRCGGRRDHRLPDHLLRTGRPRHRRGPRPRRHGPARHRARSLGVPRPGGLFIGIAPRRPDEQPGRASEPGFCHLHAASPARTPATHSDHNSSTQMLNYPRTHSPSAAQYPERPSSRCASRSVPYSVRAAASMRQRLTAVSEQCGGTAPTHLGATCPAALTPRWASRDGQQAAVGTTRWHKPLDESRL